MTFTSEDFNETCLLKDGNVAMVLQIHPQQNPPEVWVQVPGEADMRYMKQEQFDRVKGVIVQVKP